MSKKSYMKKKSFQRNCRKQVVAGFVNDHEGKWIKPVGGESQEAKAYQRMAAGYKIGR